MSLPPHARTTFLDQALRWILQPFERRLGVATTTRLCAVADHGASGVANIVAFATLGRTLLAMDFGAIGMMMGLHYFIVGFHRSAFVLIFSTTHHSDPESEAAHRENGTWWWMALAAAVLLSALTAGVAVIVMLLARAAPSVQWLVLPLFLTAIVTPAMLAWEFARRWLYKIDRADLVAFCSAGYFVTLCIGAWLVSQEWPSALPAALAWAAASIVAALLALPCLRPPPPSRAIATELIRKHRGQAGWLAATNLPYAIYSTASIVVWIGLFMGPLATAVFTAARTLTNPAISLVSAIDSVDKPRSARALAQEGMSGLRRIVRRSRALIAVVTGLYLGLVGIFAGPLTGLVFDGSYPGLESEVRLLATGFFLFGLNLPSETMLIVLQAGRTMLVIRCITATFTIAALAIGSAYGVDGMAVGFAATQILNFILLVTGERWVLSRREGLA